MLESIKEYIRRQLDRYDEKKSTAVQVVDELPSAVENRVYITEDEEENRKVYAKDIELQRADSAVLTVNEQEQDENQNITVDGSNTEATYEGEKDFIDNLLPKVGTVKTVDELPTPIDDRMYIVGSRVFAKLIELLTKEEAEDTFIPLDEKGEADGVATLDQYGKVPVGQLPSALLEYMGVWNAETNTPELSNDTVTEKNKGNVYICNVAGTWNGIEFRAGDWIICNGEIWQRSTADDLVKSVNGQQGIVELDGSNVKATYEGEKDYIDNLLPKVGKVKAVNEQLPDDQGNITVDGDSINVVYEDEEDTLNNTLPKLGKVKTVNETEPDEEGNITVDGDSINVVYEDEEDTLNNTLPKLGKVKTVNNTPPDADGNIKIPALEVVDKVEAGNMAAVTSNAVALDCVKQFRGNSKWEASSYEGDEVGNNYSEFRINLPKKDIFNADHYLWRMYHDGSVRIFRHTPDGYTVVSQYTQPYNFNLTVNANGFTTDVINYTEQTRTGMMIIYGQADKDLQARQWFEIGNVDIWRQKGFAPAEWTTIWNGDIKYVLAKIDSRWCLLPSEFIPKGTGLYISIPIVNML